MEMIKTKGIVIAQTKIGEYDKLLTVFTEELGAISVSAKGAASRHNNLKSVTRVFCYSEFLLYNKKNGYYTISEASPITDFMGLAGDLERLNAATDMVKFVKYTAVENEESGQMLRLLLNSLHLLANTEKSIDIVKCVYYMKALEYMGIPPVMGECSVCGSKENLKSFLPECGGMVCDTCAVDIENKSQMPENVRLLMHYLLSVPAEKAFGTAGDRGLFFRALEEIGLFIKIHLSYNI